MTARTEGWEGRLAAYLEERATMPFEWGAHDCCRFACGGLVVQGVPDPMHGVGRYRTERGAAMAIRRLGGTLDDAATTLAAEAGMREIAPAFAGRGCVVLAEVDIPGGGVAPALGMVGLDGAQVLFAGVGGLIMGALSDCRRAWGFD